MSQPATKPTEQSFDQWVVLSLLGHKRLAGKLTETNIAGAGFLRIDIPDKDGNTINTEYYSPTSVYSIQPVAKEIAVALATQLGPAPVSKYEVKHLLPEAKEPIEHEPGDSDEQEFDEDEDYFP